MKLLLPEYDYMFDDNMGEIKDGVLYIYRAGCFKAIMYKLTYLIFGQDKCYFCNRKLRKNEKEINKEKLFSQITLDHLIPQDFGGPTIPNNLRPSCSECNSSKGNMYPEEFKEYRKFIGAKGKPMRVSKSKFREGVLNTQEKRKYGELESIPKEWMTEEFIRNIYVNFWISEPLGLEYRKQEKFFKKYKRLPKPIVLSENKFLLDGFNTIMLAKNNYNEKISIIILENVIFKGFPD